MAATTSNPTPSSATVLPPFDHGTGRPGKYSTFTPPCVVPSSRHTRARSFTRSLALGALNDGHTDDIILTCRVNISRTTLDPPPTQQLNQRALRALNQQHSQQLSPQAWSTASTAAPSSAWTYTSYAPTVSALDLRVSTPATLSSSSPATDVLPTPTVASNASWSSWGSSGTSGSGFSTQGSTTTAFNRNSSTSSLAPSDTAVLRRRPRLCCRARTSPTQRQTTAITL